MTPSAGAWSPRSNPPQDSSVQSSQRRSSEDMHDAVSEHSEGGLSSHASHVVHMEQAESTAAVADSLVTMAEVRTGSCIASRYQCSCRAWLVHVVLCWLQVVSILSCKRVDGLGSSPCLAAAAPEGASGSVVQYQDVAATRPHCLWRCGCRYSATVAAAPLGMLAAWWVAQWWTPLSSATGSSRCWASWPQGARGRMMRSSTCTCAFSSPKVSAAVCLPGPGDAGSMLLAYACISTLSLQADPAAPWWVGL